MRSLVVSIVLSVSVAACNPGSAEQTDVSQPDTPTTASTSTTTTTTFIATTTTAAPTTTTLGPEALAQIEYDDDVKLIKAVWRAFSDQRSPGVYSWLEDHNYQPEGCTAEMYEAYYAFADGTRAEAILDPATVERDDGWTNPNGRVPDQVLAGRVYIMTITLDSVPAEVHAAVLDGEAYIFITCS